ncbi:hypothetical protein ASE74_23500 [Pedobacter sp. Leaf216]|uniref:hypothetical protein n=1 Tax=Pedobacter sp. Leaf216 TaxID=1735684 RepID=UPI0006FD3335|nr:hypothetical protein [Pedobacter sp. Leaf216]KQM70349.1 hypothetical protein ASE74_23500 [Pedobacter sp. Leaf216]
MENIKLGVTEVLATITAKIAEAYEIFRNYDNIELLGALSTNHLHNQTDKGDGGVAEIILEYGMSIASSIPMVDNLQFPSPKVLDKLIDTLSDLKLYIQYYTLESIANPKGLALTRYLGLLRNLLPKRSKVFLSEIEAPVFAPNYRYWLGWVIYVC